MSATIKTPLARLTKPLFLVGPTHVGKSYHGRKLNTQLACDLIDLDDMIVSNAGVDIATIFDFEGEEGFRAREHRALASIDLNAPAIVATGAGIVLSEENRKILQQGWVIYLKASLELLLARIQKKSDRPLFNNKNPQEVLTQMHKERAPLYEQCAHLQIDIHAENSKSDVLNHVVSFIRHRLP